MATLHTQFAHPKQPVGVEELRHRLEVLLLDAMQAHTELTVAEIKVKELRAIEQQAVARVIEMADYMTVYE